MKKHSIAITLIAVILVGGSLWVWPRLRGAWPAVGPVPSISSAPSGPLTPAEGWSVSLLADGVTGARDMVEDTFGNVWVSQTGEGIVSLVYLKNRTADQPLVNAVLKDLRKPHGLAFDPEFPTLLYIATETSIIRVPTYSDGGPEKIADLPSGSGGHFTRSLVFGPDGRLYVSIGSTCDACREKNQEHAAVISMKRDGSDRRIVARGLRNSVFMTLNPSGKEIWATDMGRDHLGDDLPPDEVNVIADGADYGWPICYGNRVHDTVFDKNQYIRDPCQDTVPPVIEIPAHSAPLGLTFIPGGDLLVAYHGSWDRSVPTGYKVVRWEKKLSGWEQSDFLTGFLKDGQAIGRPVDVLRMSDGSILVSDDKSGSLWRMSRAQ